VGKILHTLKEGERELRRRNSALSWSTESSCGQPGAVPTRFRVMDPGRATFQSVVEAVVTRGRPVEPRPRSFRALARSVVAGQAGEEGPAHSRLLHHEDSEDSLVSNTSLDSDWSDEERTELERMFGAMSERGEEQAKIRQLRRSLRRSRRPRAGSHGTGSSGPSSCTPSWDGAKLVYSRESSQSELAASLTSSSLGPGPGEEAWPGPGPGEGGGCDHG
jgi:hypothetical protein